MGWDCWGGGRRRSAPPRNQTLTPVSSACKQLTLCGGGGERIWVPDYSRRDPGLAPSGSQAGRVVGDAGALPSPLSLRDSESGASLWDVRGPHVQEHLLGDSVLPPAGPRPGSPLCAGRAAKPGRGSLRRSARPLSRRRSPGSPAAVPREARLPRRPDSGMTPPPRAGHERAANREALPAPHRTWQPNAYPKGNSDSRKGRPWL